MFIILLLLAVPPAPSEAVETYVDLVEINHYYSDGRHVFDQAIYWRKYRRDWLVDNWDFNGQKRIFGEMYNVVDWRLIRNGRKSYLREKEEWLALPADKRDGEEFKPIDQIIFEAKEGEKDEWERLNWEPPWIGSNMVPKKDLKSGLYVSTFIDGEIHRKITCGGVIETWSGKDSELTDRHYLPKEKREELSRKKFPHNK